MAKILKLKNPIMINNSSVSEMTYDANEINGMLFTEAEARRKSAAGIRNVTINPAIEFDVGLHLYLGYAAIIAVNAAYDFADLERIHGADLIAVMDIGRNFIMKPEESAPANIERPSETIPEPTTPQSETLNSAE